MFDFELSFLSCHGKVIWLIVVVINVGIGISTLMSFSAGLNVAIRKNWRGVCFFPPETAFLL